MLKTLTLTVLLLAGALCGQSTTYSTGPGTCRVNSQYQQDCLFMGYTDTAGNSQFLWFAWDGPGPSWVLWSSDAPRCDNATINAPVISASQSNPGPFYGNITGTCAGSDGSGAPVTISFTQTMRVQYSRGGGGKGGGGAGVKRTIVSGTLTITSAPQQAHGPILPPDCWWPGCPGFDQRAIRW